MALMDSFNLCTRLQGLRLDRGTFGEEGSAALGSTSSSTLEYLPMEDHRCLIGREALLAVIQPLALSKEAPMALLKGHWVREQAKKLRAAK